MCFPKLAELPPPPTGKTGWPWTEESPALPDTMPDGSLWPRVSIVTPSYNQGQFLEETIRSVLLQGYPNLEYIIMDGGSTDNSVEVIRKYEPWLAFWLSQRDRGQADAINKGFARATGEILGWVNSDDIYENGALQFAAKHFAEHSECALLYGNGWFLNSEGDRLQPCHFIKPYDEKLYRNVSFILQPAAFWKSWLWSSVGELDISCNWAMDWEWLLRATKVVSPHYLPVDLAHWRVRPEIKTLSGGQARRAELAAISRKHGGPLQPTYVVYQVDRLADRMAACLGRGPVGRLPQYPLTALRLGLRSVFAGRFVQ